MNYGMTCNNFSTCDAKTASGFSCANKIVRDVAAAASVFVFVIVSVVSVIITLLGIQHTEK